MMHTDQDVFLSYMLIFWLLQNFYMSIALQSYKRLYTGINLMLMFVMNTAFTLITYELGCIMLFAHSVKSVLCISVACICLFEALFWYTSGYTEEINGVFCAQICATGSLFIVYAFHYG